MRVCFPEQQPTLACLCARVAFVCVCSALVWVLLTWCKPSTGTEEQKSSWQAKSPSRPTNFSNSTGETRIPCRGALLSFPAPQACSLQHSPWAGRVEQVVQAGDTGRLQHSTTWCLEHRGAREVERMEQNEGSLRRRVPRSLSRAALRESAAGLDRLAAPGKFEGRDCMAFRILLPHVHDVHHESFPQVHFHFSTPFSHASSTSLVTPLCKIVFFNRGESVP